jgi:uncharacterized protein involved in outer membrane biogenesis
MYADVHFTGKGSVRKGALPIGNLSTHVVLDNGMLTLAPLGLSAAGGDLEADVSLGGRKDPMHGEATLKLRHLRLGKPFPTVDLMHTSLGQINGEAAL